jgi:hypothetical protein
VLGIVADKTGYPKDMLDMDLDLEADLGIDTVKQAETFQAVREAFAIPQQEGMNLRDYPTLESVIGFVHTMRPDLAGEELRGAQGNWEGLPQFRQFPQLPQFPRLPPPTPSPPRCWRSSPPRPAILRICWSWTWTWRPTWASTR